MRAENGANGRDGNITVSVATVTSSGHGIWARGGEAITITATGSVTVTGTGTGNSAGIGIRAEHFGQGAYGLGMDITAGTTVGGVFTGAAVIGRNHGIVALANSASFRTWLNVKAGPVTGLAGHGIEARQGGGPIAINVYGDVLGSGTNSDGIRATHTFAESINVNVRGGVTGGRHGVFTRIERASAGNHNITVSGAVRGGSGSGNAAFKIEVAGGGGDGATINLNSDASVSAANALIATGVGTTTFNVGAGVPVSGTLTFGTTGTLNLASSATVTGNVTIGDGAATIDLASAASITGDITIGNGAADIDLASGTSITGNVSIGSGAATVDLASGASITGNVTLGTASQLTGPVNSGAGTNTLTLVSGALITGSVEGGAGNDNVDLASATISGAISLGAGTNTLTLSTGAVTGAVTGGTGADIFSATGATISGTVNLGAGRNSLTLSAGALTGAVTGGTGADTVSATGATISGAVNLGAGTNQLILATATVTGAIVGGAGADTISATGATIGSTISLGAGENLLSLASTNVGTVTGGAANDTLAFTAGVSTLSGTLANFEDVEIASGATAMLRGGASSASLAGDLTLSGALNLQDGAMATLAVTGDFTGGGVLHVDANFTAQTSDRITIGGDVSGVTNIFVNTLGGLSTNAVTLVQFAVGSTFSATNFQLDPEMVGFELELSGTTLSLAEQIYAQGCAETSTGSGVFECGGALSSTQTLSTVSSTELEVKTDRVMTASVANGKAFILTSSAGITFDQFGSGTISGRDGGIFATNTDTGSINIHARGSVTGVGGDDDIDKAAAIAATNTGTQTGDITITAADVTGFRGPGVMAVNRGTGSVRIHVVGSVTQYGQQDYPIVNQSAAAIYARTEASGSDLSISIVRKAGAPADSPSITMSPKTSSSAFGRLDKAIDTKHYGSGSLTISVEGEIRGAVVGVQLTGSSSESIAINVPGGIVASKSGIRITSNPGAGRLLDGAVTISAGDLRARSRGKFERAGANSAVTVQTSGTIDITLTGHVDRTDGAFGEKPEALDIQSTLGKAVTITLESGAEIDAAGGFAVIEKDGDAAITVNTGAWLQGFIDLGKGDDSVTVSGGEISQASMDGGLGTDTLSVTGGTASITSVNNVEAASVSGGSLKVDSMTVPTLTIESGGTFKTAGTVTATTLNLRGRLDMADGANFTTFNATTINPGGTFVFDVDFAGQKADKGFLAANGSINSNSNSKITIEAVRVGDVSPNEVVVFDRAQTAVLASGAFQLAAGSPYTLRVDQGQGRVYLSINANGACTGTTDVVCTGIIFSEQSFTAGSTTNLNVSLQGAEITATSAGASALKMIAPAGGTGRISLVQSSVNAKSIIGSTYGIYAKDEGSGGVNINVVGEVKASGVAAVYVSDHSPGNVVINAAGGAEGGDSGVEVTGTGTGTVSIQTGGVVRGDGAGAADAGIRVLRADSSAGATTVTAASVSGASHGIYVKTENDSGVVNIAVSGRVQSSGAGRAAIRAEGGNDQTVTLLSGADVGTDSSAKAIELVGDGAARRKTVTIRSGATLRGAVSFATSASNLRLEGGRVVDGSVTMGAGADTITLSGGRFEGRIDGGGGQDRINVESGTTQINVRTQSVEGIFVSQDATLQVVRGTAGAGDQSLTVFGGVTNLSLDGTLSLTDRVTGSPFGLSGLRVSTTRGGTIAIDTNFETQQSDFLVLTAGQIAAGRVITIDVNTLSTSFQRGRTSQILQASGFAEGQIVLSDAAKSNMSLQRTSSDGSVFRYFLSQSTPFGNCATDTIGGHTVVTCENVRFNSTQTASANGTGNVSVTIGSNAYGTVASGDFFELRQTGGAGGILLIQSSAAESFEASDGRGIEAANTGGGAVTISMVGAVRASGDGIYVSNDSQGGPVSITAGSVSGGASGIRVQQIGSADVTVSVSGRVVGGTGRNHSAIVVNAAAAGSVIINVNSGATVGRTDGSGAAISNGAGNAAVTVKGTVLGDVSLGAGNDTLTISGGMLGGAAELDGGAGTDTLTFNSSATAAAISGWETVAIGSMAVATVGGDFEATTLALTGGATASDSSGTLNVSDGAGGAFNVANITGNGVIALDVGFADSSSTDDLVISGDVTGTVTLKVNLVGDLGQSARIAQRAGGAAITGTFVVGGGFTLEESGGVYTLTYPVNTEGCVLDTANTSLISSVYTCSGLILTGQTLSATTNNGSVLVNFDGAIVVPETATGDAADALIIGSNTAANASARKTLTQVANGFGITGQRHGVSTGDNARHVSINVTGTVTGRTGIGILVKRNAISAGDVEITAADVVGSLTGIEVVNTSGNSKITTVVARNVTGRGTGAQMAGIVLKSPGSASSDSIVNISAANVEGANHGILVSGMISERASVTVPGKVTGKAGDGIRMTRTRRGRTDFALGEVSGSGTGVNFTLEGAGGDLSLTATGTVSGATGDGIKIYNKNVGGGSTVSLSVADVRGGASGIDFKQLSSTLTLTISADSIEAGSVSGSATETAGIKVEGTGNTNNSVTATARSVRSHGDGILVTGQFTGGINIRATESVRIIGTGTGSAAGTGIKTEADARTVVHAGTGSGATFRGGEVYGRAHGIYINKTGASGDRNTIVNAGSVTGLGGDGIRVKSDSSNAPVGVTTTGSVRGSAGDGIYVNANHISGANVSIVASGTVSGSQRGINVRGGSLTNTTTNITVSGRVIGGAGAAIQVAGLPANITLNSGASVGQLRGGAIRIDFGTRTVSRPGTVTVNSGAEILGSVTFNNARNDTLNIHGGLVRGSALLGAGDDRLNISGGGRAVGTVFGGTGNNDITVSGIGGSINAAPGFRNLTINTGATLRLAGAHTFAGAISLNEGTLDLSRDGQISVINAQSLSNSSGATLIVDANFAQRTADRLNNLNNPNRLVIDVNVIAEGSGNEVEIIRLSSSTASPEFVITSSKASFFSIRQSGTSILLRQDAIAGTCEETFIGSGIFGCTGELGAQAPFVAAGTKLDFRLNDANVNAPSASGLTLVQSGAGGIVLTQSANGGDIQASGGSAIAVTNTGGGDVSLTVTGRVISLAGVSQAGIRVSNDANSGAVTISAGGVISSEGRAVDVVSTGTGGISITTSGAVSGDVGAISAISSGTGDVAVLARGTLAATSGTGIYARAGAGSDVTITAAELNDIGQVGIQVKKTGAGDVSIKLGAPNVAGSSTVDGSAIVVEAGTGAGGVTVDASNVNATENSTSGHGIDITTSGSGDVSVIAHDVKSTRGAAVNVADSGSGTIDIALSGSVTGGSSGVYVSSPNDVEITSTGTVSGGRGIYAKATGAITLNVASATGTINAIRVDALGTATVSVSATGAVTATNEYDAGIRVSGTNASTVTVTAANVSAAGSGIEVSAGGDISIAATGPVQSNGGNAIYSNMRGAGTSRLTVSGPVSTNSTNAVNAAINMGVFVATNANPSAFRPTIITLDSGANVSGTQAIKVSLHANAAVTVNSGATISGEIETASGADTVTVAGGSAASEIDLGAGNDTLAVTGGTVTGTLTGGGGTDTLRVAGGTISGAISEWETVTVESGGQANILGSATATTLSVQGTLNLSDSAIGRFASSGNFVGGGVVVIDANFTSNTADSLQIGGNVTGAATRISLVGTGITDGTAIEIINVTGQANANAFVLSATDSLEYNLTFANSKFSLVGKAEGSCTLSSGVYTCSGPFRTSRTFSSSTTPVHVVMDQSVSVRIPLTSPAPGHGVDLQTSGANNDITLTQSGTAGLITASATGVRAVADGANISINTQGRVIGRGGDGIFAESNLTNSGAITVRASGAVVGSGANSHGIHAKLGSSSGGRLVQIAAADVQGAKHGIYAEVSSGGRAEIAVSGSVSGGASGHGIYVKSGNSDAHTITLESGARVSGGGKAIDARSGSVMLRATNATISGDISLGTAQVNLVGTRVLGGLTTGSGTNTVSISGGSVSGNLTLSSSGDTLTINDVAVTGNVALGDGNDRVILNGARITGNLDLGGGTDRITFGPGYSKVTGNLDGEDNGDDQRILIESGAVVHFGNGRTVGSNGFVEIKAGAIAILDNLGQRARNIDRLDIEGTLNTADGTSGNNDSSNPISGFNVVLRLSTHAEMPGSWVLDVNFANGVADQINSTNLSANWAGPLTIEPVIIAEQQGGASSIDLSSLNRIDVGAPSAFSVYRQGSYYYVRQDMAIGACTSAGSGAYTCAGLIHQTQTLSAVDEALEVTLNRVGVVHALKDTYNGLMLSQSGAGSIALTQSATGGRIAAAGHAIHASNAGAGSVSIVVTGNVIGGLTGRAVDADGITALDSADGQGVYISAAAVSGIRHGIVATAAGSGGARVKTTGDVAGKLGTAALIDGGSGGATVTIGGSVAGGKDGIRATAAGGTVSISVSGSVSGAGGVGVSLDGGSGSVEANIRGAVSGGTEGIRAAISGGGALTISAGESVSGGTHGIRAAVSGGGALSISVDGSVSGATGTGVSIDGGSGNATVNIYGAVSGGTDGIRAAVSGGSALTISVDGSVSGTAGTGVAINAGVGSVSLSVGGAVAGVSEGVSVSGSGAVSVSIGGDVTLSASQGRRFISILNSTSSAVAAVSLESGASISDEGVIFHSDAGAAAFTVGAGASVEGTGTFEFGGGNDALIVHGSVDARSTQHDFGAGTDTLTVKSGGDVEIGGLAGLENVAVETGGMLSLPASFTLSALEVGGTLDIADGATSANTVSGNFVGGGGVIMLDANFSTQASDTLSIGGNLSGTTAIQVRESGDLATDRAIQFLTVTGNIAANATVVSSDIFTSVARVPGAKRFRLSIPTLGSCSQNGGSGPYTCSGVLRTQQTLASATNLTVIMNRTAGLRLGAVTSATLSTGFYLRTTGGDLTFTQSANGREITGNSFGIRAWGDTSTANRDVRVTTTGKVTGRSGTGIYIERRSPGGATIVNAAGTVSGIGSVTSDGIFAYANTGASNGGLIQIAAVDVEGGRHGINTKQAGSGSRGGVSITILGSVSGGTGTGIRLTGGGSLVTNSITLADGARVSGSSAAIEVADGTVELVSENAALKGSVRLPGRSDTASLVETSIDGDLDLGGGDDTATLSGVSVTGNINLGGGIDKIKFGPGFSDMTRLQGVDSGVPYFGSGGNDERRVVIESGAVVHIRDFSDFNGNGFLDISAGAIAIIDNTGWRKTVGRIDIHGTLNTADGKTGRDDDSNPVFNLILRLNGYNEHFGNWIADADFGTGAFDILSWSSQGNFQNWRGPLTVEPAIAQGRQGGEVDIGSASRHVVSGLPEVFSARSGFNTYLIRQEMANGACTSEGSGVYTCANLIWEEQTLSARNEALDVTLNRVGVVHALAGTLKGLTLSQAGDGGITLTQEAAGGRIATAGHAIQARNEGAGGVSIVVTGEVIGGMTGRVREADGITAIDGEDGDGVYVSAVDVSGIRHGITAITEGSGGATVKAAGNVTGKFGNAIVIDGGSGDATAEIDGTVSGATGGVSVTARGSGAVSVRVEGFVDSRLGAGVDISAGTGGANVQIGGSVNGPERGVRAVSQGAGGVSIVGERLRRLQTRHGRRHLRRQRECLCVDRRLGERRQAGNPRKRRRRRVHQRRRRDLAHIVR